MARLLKTTIGVCSVLVLSGCALQQVINPPRNHEQASAAPVQEPKTVMVKAASKADRLLMYYKRVLALPAEEYNAELQAVKTRMQDSDEWDSQLHYALLLLRPDSDFRDIDKAAELFGRFEAENGQDEDEFLLSSLSLLMTGILEENRKTAEMNRDLTRQLNESQKQLQHVQDQINALKSIEKSIHERNTRVGNEDQ